MSLIFLQLNASVNILFIVQNSVQRERVGKGIGKQSYYSRSTWRSREVPEKYLVSTNVDENQRSRTI
jgi:hypothetical protein